LKPNQNLFDIVGGVELI